MECTTIIIITVKMNRHLQDTMIKKNYRLEINERKTVSKEEKMILSPILSDGAVLQRERINIVNGYDENAKKVTVTFLDKEYSSFVEEDGSFRIELPPMPMGGPYELSVIGSSIIRIKDIYFGDVYLLSGQSNMELPVRRVLEESGEEAANTRIPLIREYHIPATYNFKEEEKLVPAASWKKAEGTAVYDFSALGLFFAKELYRKYQVPIGLIMTAVGGSGIESWMKKETLQRFEAVEHKIEAFKDAEYFKDFLLKQERFASLWKEEVTKEDSRSIMKEDLNCWRPILVPSLVSETELGRFSGELYFCKDIILDDEPNDGAYLSMGSIIDSDEIWINGSLIGKTEYRYPPRKYSIEKGILKQGSNRILVRMIVNQENGGFIKGKSYYLFCNGSKIDLEGEWKYRIGCQAKTERPIVLFPPSLPVGLYNGLIAPLVNVNVKGVLWYQGESNCSNYEQYKEKFEAMVEDFRTILGEVPVLFVQLANYREPLNASEYSGWAEMREQQQKCLGIKNTAMAVAIDLGESCDLHPQKKKELGVRLAKAAEALLYGEAVEYQGPELVKAERNKERVVLTFEHLDLQEEQMLKHFEIRGEDGVFHEASAVACDNRVVVFSEAVSVPEEVRYAWRDNPENTNFYNSAGFPASPFRITVTV